MVCIYFRICISHKTIRTANYYNSTNYPFPFYNYLVLPLIDFLFVFLVTTLLYNSLCLADCLLVSPQGNLILSDAFEVFCEDSYDI